MKQSSVFSLLLTTPLLCVLLSNSAATAQDDSWSHTGGVSWIEFKRQHRLRSDVDVRVVTISPDTETIQTSYGQEISLLEEDLDPVDVVSPRGMLIVDGTVVPSRNVVYTSRYDSNIMIAKNPFNGATVSVSTEFSDGSFEDFVLLPNSTSAFATIASDTVDPIRTKSSATDGIEPPFHQGGTRRRRLRGQTTNTTTTSRSLQACYSFKEVEISVVMDSRLCSQLGGASQAESMIQQTVAAASRYYEKPGLCVRLKLLNRHIHCNSNSDPVRSLLDRSSADVCATNGLLDQFAAYVRRTPSITGDAVHLFHGRDMGGAGIGCAYYGTLCERTGYQSGVEEMVGQSSTQRAKLLAHEMGHILNARHLSDRNEMMYGDLCGGACNNNFGPTSIKSMNDELASKSCASTVGGSSPSGSTGNFPSPTPPRTPPTPGWGSWTGSFGSTPTVVRTPPTPPSPPTFSYPRTQPNYQPTWSGSNPSFSFPTFSTPSVRTDSTPNVRTFPTPVVRTPTRQTPSWGNNPLSTLRFGATSSCQDDRLFTFFINGVLVDCEWLSKQDFGTKIEVCGYDFVDGNCPFSCGECS